MKKLCCFVALLMSTSVWAQDVCGGNAPFVQVNKTTVNVARGESITLSYCDRINKTTGYRVTRDKDTVYVDVSAETTRNQNTPIRAMNIPVDLRNVGIDKDKINVVVRAYTSYTVTGETPMVFSPIEVATRDRQLLTTSVSDPTGSWYDPVYNGAGFVLMQVPHGSLIQFYGYTRNGQRLWLLSDVMNETWVLGKSKTMKIYHGFFGNAATFDLAPTQPPGLAEWGTLKIQFDSCNKGSAVLTGLDGSKTFALQRVATLTNIQCASTASQ